MNLVVNEIFYSLQGEGSRTGEASIFIRLTKCNLRCEFCDTDFASGVTKSLEDIFLEISKYPCKWIIWTGGEPTLQLNDSIIEYFSLKGYKQAIETNGTRVVPKGIDYVTCSPKQKYGQISEKLPFVNEIRVPISYGNTLPEIDLLPKADFYFLSPVFDGDNLNMKNINYCIDLIKKHTRWRLSLQVHKLINIQ